MTVRHLSDNNYFIGRTLFDPVRNIRRVIQRVEDSPDMIYRMTDGYAGNGCCIYVMMVGGDECEAFAFRNFIEVIQKYGEIDREKPSASLTVKPQPSSLKRWAKIHPELSSSSSSSETIIEDL